MDDKSQYRTALGLAKRALDYIAQYGTPPTPHAYEVFYTVCAGLNPKLNEALAIKVAKSNRLSADDVETLYAEHLLQEPPSEKMEEIGSQMGSEMKAVLQLLGAVSSSANSYQASLQSAEEQLTSETSGQNLHEMVRSLLNATQTMARTNAEMTTNLETSRAQMVKLEDCLKIAREESSRDSLTGLVNRKQFDLLLDEALITADKNKKTVSLLMIDIDHFKTFNDTHGHAAGDSALRYVGSCIKSNIKGQDTAARYGGEEFSVILPDTQMEHAISLAERIRHLVNARSLVKKATGENMGRISVSIGVAEMREDDTSESLINRADLCMYAAKQSGRNQVANDPAQPAEAAPVAGAA